MKAGFGLCVDYGLFAECILCAGILLTAVRGENHPSRRQTSAHEASWVFHLAALAPETLNRTVSGVVGLFGQTAFTTSLANALMVIAAIADLHLLSILAFLGQHLMCMTLDALSLIVGLELQNLAVLVLCGLNGSFAVEAAIKLLLLSAYSSAMLLMGNSSMMAVSGLTGWLGWYAAEGVLVLVTVGLVWKIGAAPLHMWLVAVYQSVWTGVSLYVSTAPKLAAFGFWLKWQPIVHYAGDRSVAPFAFLSLLTGAVNALAQPLMKPLLAYSAVGMNGILLMAIHAAENGAFWVNLIVYLWTMTLAWPLLSDFNLVSLTDRFRSGRSAGRWWRFRWRGCRPW
jgi:NADH:ubiquinone oxidoreductase subunit 2 (subunit N)